MKFCKVKGCRFTHSHTTSGHICGKCGKRGHGIIECGNSEVIRNLNSKYGGDILPKDLRCTDTLCPTFFNHTNDGHHCIRCKKRHKTSDCDFKINLKCPICNTNNVITKDNINIKGLDVKCCVCLENNADVIFMNCKHINTCFECCKKLDTNNQFNNDVEDILSTKILSESQIDLSVYIPNIEKFKESMNDMNEKSYIKVYGGMGCLIFIRRKLPSDDFEIFFMHNDSYGQYGIEVDDRPYLKIFLEDYNLFKDFDEN